MLREGLVVANRERQRPVSGIGEPEQLQVSGAVWFLLRRVERALGKVEHRIGLERSQRGGQRRGIRVEDDAPGDVPAGGESLGDLARAHREVHLVAHRSLDVLQGILHGGIENRDALGRQFRHHRSLLSHRLMAWERISEMSST